MLTNVATALFGLADMWVIGRLGDASAQGAVELGAKFMLALLNTFNFLRTGTIALTAQAAGRGSEADRAQTLVRALGASFLIAALLLLAKPFAIAFGLDLLEAGDAVADEARTYIGIRYWAGVAWLVNAVLVGWLIGQRRVRTVLAVEVAANVVHIGLDVLFVLSFGWGVAGVAAATLVSEGLKFAVLALLVLRLPAARGLREAAVERATWQASRMRELFSLNRDLFFRTLLLSGAMLIFARSGAQQGAVVLAANGILFQLFMLATLALDGFENAAQVLVGEAQGARSRERFAAILKSTLAWGFGLGVVLALAYLVAGEAIARSFSTDEAVSNLAAEYVGWVVLLPLVGSFSFVLDGVFVGAAWTRAMLLTMLAAIAVYVGILWAGSPLTNTGLWIAFVTFFVVRAAAQFAVLPRLVRREFG